jgi:hypothetical protein
VSNQDNRATWFAVFAVRRRSSVGRRVVFATWPNQVALLSWLLPVAEGQVRLTQAPPEWRNERCRKVIVPGPAIQTCRIPWVSRIAISSA